VASEVDVVVDVGVDMVVDMAVVTGAVDMVEDTAVVVRVVDMAVAVAMAVVDMVATIELLPSTSCCMHLSSPPAIFCSWISGYDNS
jgi:hypothetical protein